MRLAVIALSLIASPAFATDVVKESFDAQALKNLLVEQGAGKVTITASEAARATVTATKIKYDESSCKLAVALDGKTLKISNKDGWTSPNAKCEVDFAITVPAHVDAKLKVGAGNLDVTGLKGELEYELGSGDVTVQKSSLKELDGKSGSGNVTIDGTLEEAELKIGAGNADLKLAKANRKSTLDVKLGTGKATINLPKDATVKSSFKAGLGSLTNEFGQSDNAAFTISGAAGAGDMEIKRF